MTSKKNEHNINWKMISWPILKHLIVHDQTESTKQMEEKLNFQVPAEGIELVILLHTQY
mgnify:FL=1